MKFLQETESLVVLFGITLGILYYKQKNKIDWFKSIEAASIAPFVHVVLVILNHVIVYDKYDTPSIIKKFTNSRTITLIITMFAMFTAIHDVESTILITIGYLLFIQLLRTPEERKLKNKSKLSKKKNVEPQWSFDKNGRDGCNP